MPPRRSDCEKSKPGFLAGTRLEVGLKMEPRCLGVGLVCHTCNQSKENLHVQKVGFGRGSICLLINLACPGMLDMPCCSLLCVWLRQTPKLEATCPQFIVVSQVRVIHWHSLCANVGMCVLALCNFAPTFWAGTPQQWLRRTIPPPTVFAFLACFQRCLRSFFFPQLTAFDLLQGCLTPSPCPRVSFASIC